MKICIVGAGAVGGFLGSRLSSRGHQTSAIDCGKTLDALRGHGWRLQTEAGIETYPVTAVADAAELGPQDLVIVAVKGHTIPVVAAAIAPLLGPDTMVMTAINGIPWWFCDGLKGTLAGATLTSVDRDGDLRAKIPSRHVIGCVVFATCSVPEPGITRHGFGNGLILGEALGGGSPRLTALVEVFKQAGFQATGSQCIQSDIWYKLWGNMTHNPVSALTGATCDRIIRDPLLRDFCAAVMGEAAAIGERIGCPVSQSAEDRNAATLKLGAFKTSMLQDVEAGKPLEIDGLLTVVNEIASRVGIAAPNSAALLGLVRLFAQVRGLAV
ncbi:MAG: 2-dehydropantoate 2-reductase [Proteobacteria bacterium]|nr:2-dehydropantoate 2-reductase [Pseudomonadota bacterium]